MDIVRATSALVVSIVIISAILVAMLVDGLAGHATIASAQLGTCTGTVHPAVHTLEFIDARC
ncbi:MAG TPA: hypothetical protein VHT50_32055 [Mycobacterium sp.]|jgi:hypothetical protein|nr:hypothetical protein [Mycobacterium sp.]